MDLFFFSLTIILPIRNKWTDECDAPKWGVSYHNETFWIYRGGKGNMKGGNKWWTFYAPWSLQWIRTSMLRIDGTWEDETKNNRKNFYEDKWKKILWTETHPYVYILNRYYSYDDILQKSFNTSNIQQINATIKLVEREYRPHWFKKIPIFRKITKSIDIEFDKEVGERAGNYKGGTVGCSYELLPKETPLECLRRMEKERKF